MRERKLRNVCVCVLSLLFELLIYYYGESPGVFSPQEGK